MIRVLLADDHPLFRDGLRALIESVDDLSVIAEASTGDEAVTRALSLVPDAVLMDIKMPDLNGIEATRRIVRQNPRIMVLMLTMFEDDDSVFAAIRAGARGYLLKGARQEETLRAIRAVANGEVIFGPGIAQRVIQLLSRPQPAAQSPLFPQLTDREYEILDLIARRCSNAEIASRLVLSPKTVRNYVSSILDKLQVTDRAEARIAAQSAGLGDESVSALEEQLPSPHHAL
jgi:DNA-binding NarL/FixJ family response regulator